MNPSNRGTARFVGALFLFSNVTFLLGAFVLVEPLLADPDTLLLLSANRPQVVLGTLLEILNAVAYLGIAVLVFPLFRERFPSLSLGYVGLRILEFVMQTLSDLSPLALLTLSGEAMRAGAADAPSFRAAGTLLVAQRFWAFQMVSLTFGLGALVFYSMLYRSKLVPRFISVWGLVGAVVVLIILAFDLFEVPYGALGALSLLMLANELFLGGWLIIKGFNPTAGGSPPPLHT